jgi:hypothetical protein
MSVLGPLGALSTLPFRILCRRHGVPLSYGNYIYPDVFMRVRLILPLIPFFVD